MLADLALMALGLWVAWGIRFQLGITVFQPSSGEPGLYLPLGAGLCGLWRPALRPERAVWPFCRKLLGGTGEYALIFQGMSTGLIVVAFVTLLPEFVLARAWLLPGWALVGFLVGTGRFIARRAVYALRAQGWFLAPALIVGTGAEAAALEQQLGGAATAASTCWASSPPPTSLKTTGRGISSPWAGCSSWTTSSPAMTWKNWRRPAAACAGPIW